MRSRFSDMAIMCLIVFGFTVMFPGVARADCTTSDYYFFTITTCDGNDDLPPPPEHPSDPEEAWGMCLIDWGYIEFFCFGTSPEDDGGDGGGGIPS